MLSESDHLCISPVNFFDGEPESFAGKPRNMGGVGKAPMPVERDIDKPALDFKIRHGVKQNAVIGHITPLSDNATPQSPVGQGEWGFNFPQDEKTSLRQSVTNERQAA